MSTVTTACRLKSIKYQHKKKCSLLWQSHLQGAHTIQIQNSRYIYLNPQQASIIHAVKKKSCTDRTPTPLTKKAQPFIDKLVPMLKIDGKQMTAAHDQALRISYHQAKSAYEQPASTNHGNHDKTDYDERI